MKIDKNEFPILGCLNNNKLTDGFFDMLFNSGYDDKGIKDTMQSFDFFLDKQLRISAIPLPIHEKIWCTNDFLRAKPLLANSPEVTGLLLLPETILPDFTNVPNYVDVDPNDYPINAILYSWLSSNNHDKISNRSHLKDLQKRIITGEIEPETGWKRLLEKLCDEEGLWPESDRTLIIIPIHNDRITQATRQYELINHDDMYGDDYSNREGRAWYGKVHDYVMSFILYYNFAELEAINSVNSIEIIL